MMKKISIYFAGLYALFSCQKEPKNNQLETNKDSITEITYNTDPKDILANKNTELLLDHLEDKQLELKEKLKNIKNKQEGDILFAEYYKSFGTIIDSLNSSESTTLSYYSSWANKNKPDSVMLKEKRFDKLGIFIRNIDSNYYDIKLLPGFYHKLFKGKISNELEDYLKIATKYNQLNYDVQMNKTTFEPSKYRDLALDWETYLKKHPKTTYKDRVNKLYQETVLKYLLGDKNNRTFDPVSKKIHTKIESEYILFVKKYPKTQTAIITKEFMKYFYANEQIATSKNFYKELQNRTIEEINTNFIQWNQ